jgi:hypothetical protein
MYVVSLTEYGYTEIYHATRYNKHNLANSDHRIYRYNSKRHDNNGTLEEGLPCSIEEQDRISEKVVNVTEVLFLFSYCFYFSVSSYTTSNFDNFCTVQLFGFNFFV